MEEKLIRSDFLHRQMIVEIQDYAIVSLDIDGKILTWNKGVEKIQGYSESEIIGQNFRIFYLPQDRLAGLPEHLLELATREGRASHTGRRLRKNGSIFWANSLITAIHRKIEVVGFTILTRELREGQVD
ncbi:MAG: PAS domain S-box protein [Bacteroidota bacterium]